MATILWFSILCALTLLHAVPSNTEPQNKSILDALHVGYYATERYKQECRDEGVKDSLLPCLLKKISHKCSNTVDDANKRLPSSTCIFAWMHSLPVLTANSIIINEAPNSLKIDNEPTAGVPIKDAFYGFMYYKVDYKSFYELLKHHDQKDSKEHEAKNSIWKIILPPNMVINASSAHTMPFHEDMTVKLHGSIGSKNAFVLLFHMEAFKVIIEEKVKIAFRIRMDRLWHLRRRMHFNNIKSYLKSIVLRFKNRNFIYRRLKHYDFSWIKRKPNDPFPLIPFFNIVKDDFYKILDGTSLLKQEVTVGDIEDHTKDVSQHIHREVDVLVENINRFIVDGKCVMVEKTEPFYVAEVSIRSSIYTFYNAMSPKVCHKLWQKPARYMITAELKDAKHIRMVMAIVKMVFLTTIATVASFFALLSYLTHTKPWRI